jgi:Zn ribbon nucleic-acid-binding protein
MNLLPFRAMPKRSQGDYMSTAVSNRRFSFGVNCVQCSNRLIAPESSEYWNERRVRHAWRCCECDSCFETVADTETMLLVA